MLSWDFLSSAFTSFSLTGPHPGPITFSCHVSIGARGLWQLLRPSWLLMTLIGLRRLTNSFKEILILLKSLVFCAMFLN